MPESRPLRDQSDGEVDPLIVTAVRDHIRSVEAENECWREVVAHVARVIEAQCFDIPRLGKNRTEILHRVVAEMREAAVGNPRVVYAGHSYFTRELKNLREGRR
jgi:hypothetical protein